MAFGSILLLWAPAILSTNRQVQGPGVHPGRVRLSAPSASLLQFTLPQDPKDPSLAETLYHSTLRLFTFLFYDYYFKKTYLVS